MSFVVNLFEIGMGEAYPERFITEVGCADLSFTRGDGPFFVLMLA